jgi:hypothetical protein
VTDKNAMEEHEMTIVLAAQLAVWLTLGIATGLLAAISALAVVAGYLAVIEGGAGVAEVQRFKDLTEEARRLASPSDGETAAYTTAAIGAFQAKKDEARRALWASRDAQRAAAAAHSTTSRPVPGLRVEEVWDSHGRPGKGLAA